MPRRAWGSQKAQHHLQGTGQWKIRWKLQEKGPVERGSGGKQQSLNEGELGPESIPAGALGGYDINCRLNKLAVQKDRSDCGRGQEGTSESRGRETLLQHAQER